MRAIISVTLDDSLAIHDLKIIEKDNRLFLAMPSRMGEDGIFRDVVHPIDEDTRRRFEDKIIYAYEEYMSNSVHNQ